MNIPSDASGSQHVGLRRHGFTLPFVVIALAAVGILAMTFATVTIRDVTAADRATHAQRIALTARASLAQAAHQWRDDSLWARDLATSIVHTTALANGDHVSVELHRTHPLSVTIRAVASFRDRRHPVEVRRELQQVLWLAPPTIPQHAALTVLGNVAALDPTLITGVDLVGGQSPCGAERDTLSVADIAAHTVQADSAGVWTLMPVMPPAPVDSSGAFDAVRTAALSMGMVISRSAAPAALPVSMTASPAWHLLSLQGSDVQLAGTNAFRGLLLIDGDLTLTGALTVEGILLVRGALDTRHGQLVVNGRVAVLGVGVAPGNTAARLGSATRVQFDRCRVDMALATIAAPQTAPFQLHTLGTP